MLLNRRLGTRLLHIFALIPAGALVGALLGAALNFVNVWISPEYFDFVLWDGGVDDSALWWSAVQQGVLEGGGSGVLVAFGYALVVFWVSRMSSSFSFAARCFKPMFSAVVVCWLAGGLNVLLLALCWPQFPGLSAMIPGAVVPKATFPRQWAWVEGSTWSLQVGAFAAFIAGSILFSRRWKHHPH